MSRRHALLRPEDDVLVAFAWLIGAALLFYGGLVALNVLLEWLGVGPITFF